MNLMHLALRLTYGQRLPVTEGSCRIPGIHGQVLIRRDRYGVPLIECGDGRDLAFAIGFCHGQDRSFQLEKLLRVARGTVSAMVGSQALPIDRLSRRVGFHRSAVIQLAQLDSDIRERLQRYADGVQAGREIGSSQLAHEFALLGIAPTPWTPADTLAVTKLMSFTLCSNWDSELVRLKVLASDGPEALRALDASYPEWQPVVYPAGQSAGRAVDRLSDDLSAMFTMVRPGGGSNNWVLSGTKTATGRPILACDPHLDAGLPSHWYLLSVCSPQEQLCGASFVGGPAVLAGHNGFAAWGLTAGFVDNTDLFLEEIGPDDASVRRGDGFVPCEVREEVIEVRGAVAVSERVLTTPRGPIISPGLHETHEVLSLRATWLDPLPMTGFFRLGHVRSFEQFREAFRHWPASPQNLVYADVTGDIGYQLICRAPRRKKGYGLLPLPGRDPEAGWHDEAVSFEETPHLKNPACGYLATANTRHQPEGQGPYLGSDFIDGYRLKAIDRALRSRDDWDVAAVMRLQMDRHAVVWEEVREAVLSSPADPEVLALLRDWDGDTGPESFAAAVYELFLAEMITRIAKAKAPKSWRWVVGAGLSPMTPHNFGCFRRTGHLVRLLREQPDGWFLSPWPEEVADALGRAARMAHDLLSENKGGGWGDIHPLVLHHPLSKAAGLCGRVMAGIFNLGPVPIGGDGDVINSGWCIILPNDPRAPTDNIATLRITIDVGAWHNSRFVLPAGQSGNPLSPHYADQLPLWLRGEGIPIATTPDEMGAAAVRTLELVPHCSPFGTDSKS